MGREVHFSLYLLKPLRSSATSSFIALFLMFLNISNIPRRQDPDCGGLEGGAQSAHESTQGRGSLLGRGRSQ